ncbi:MAG: hypothetical protein A4E40_00738 [Methanoregulaceae archaeon PtaU1.Bin059]|nr:MAG: hypothetical protein A4E39_01610 [Methanoregulaceae archaeon PtaB.Bin152]OPY40822.1 MAG: hypothetical protein A4E40_00738 [Methanoregulaceae archaeon PtaU1.Bin059]
MQEMKTRTLPLPIHLDAADMTVLMALVQRPAMSGYLARSIWLDPSHIYLAAGRSAHR